MQTKTIQNISILLTELQQKLQLDPYNPVIYNQLANLYYKINQIEQSIYYYKRALHISPQNPEIHFNLANCYVKKNFIPDAISHYKFCLELNPNFLIAMQNLGMLLVEIKNFQEALPYLVKVYTEDLEIQKNFVFIEQLANCYLQSGDIPNAIENLKHAINVDPTQETAHHNLAILYLRNQQHNLAIKHFNLTLQLNPNNQTALHMLAALMKNNPQQAPIEYIVNLFDQYADYYTNHVNQKLNYNLPIIFRNLYAKYANGITAKNVLDLGCGTGLCGIYFRDASINLIGVDISINMLLQAKNHAYDLLIEANLQKNSIFINNYFDLIIAADVLPYFGDLNNIFQQFKLLLQKNNASSMLLFNIELNEHQNTKDFELQTSGRYSHNLNYIQQLAKFFDFSIIENNKQIIRTHNDQPLIGLTFLLQHL